MPGRPKRAAMIKAIEAQGGEDAVLDRIAAGETISSIAVGFGVSRQALSARLNETPDGRAAVMRAREMAAHVLAEEALRIADEADNSNDRAKRLQIDTRRWIASRWNRDAYGDSPAVQVGGLSIQQLHLDSLRRVRPEDCLPPQTHLIEAPKADDESEETP